MLDPGHDGGNARHAGEIATLVPAGGFRKPCNTVGTETRGGYAEHAFDFDVARRAARLLSARGATVTLTRSTDTGVGPCVNTRAAIGNARHADAVVSIHADGAATVHHGFHVVEPGLAPDRRNKAILASSARLASRLRREFAAVSGVTPASYPGIISPGLARRDDLAGLNLSRVPAVLIQCGNMKNQADARRMISSEGRRRIAEGIAQGITAYLVALKK